MTGHPLTVDDAMSLPLWEAQVALERGMLREGADRFRDSVIRATEQNQMTSLAPVRGLISEWLPQCAALFTEWRRTMARQRGPVPIALEYLRDADPYVVCLIGLRGILASIGSNRQHITGLAINIGGDIEHEMKVRLWEGSKVPEERASFHKNQQRMEREGVTNSHRGRVNIYLVNQLIASGASFDWADWSQDAKYRVGVAVIEAITRATNWFELVPDEEFAPKKGAKRGPKLMLQARAGLISWLGKSLDQAEITHPVYLPTIIPPRRWEGTRSGGYWTPYVKPPALVKFKASQVDQRKHAADEYDAIEMPKVMQALHFLQEVPWRVNQRVYAIAEWAIVKDLGIAGLPTLGELPEPPRPADIDTNEAALIKWKRMAKRVRIAGVKKASKVRSTATTLRIAKDFKEHEKFYFPYMLDFRGRLYPIPGGLQPQGNDLAKGLLEFHEGKAVSVANGGVRWMAIQVASWWGEGKDKLPFVEREVWVRENEALWRSIASDPKRDLRWAADAVDKPFQALAAIIDWVGYLDHGDGYVSHAPIAVDGTCNGIQHLSAMTHDRVAGEHVNLVPGTKPMDIYKFVANTLQAQVERLAVSQGEPGEFARYWLGVCGGDMPRSLLKRPVMVLPYGGSKEAFFKYTSLWLDDVDPMPEEAGHDEWSLRGKRVHWLVGLMWDAVNASVSGAMVVMKWLQLCAKKTATSNQPLFWVTASGFVVRHFYGKQKDKQVEMLFNGERTQVRLSETTKELDAKTQLTGIPPNFVHSQDASALVLCINRLPEQGVSAFTAVHDAYGSHAADMDKVATALREGFVEVHSAGVLAQFRAACQHVVGAILMDTEGLDPLEAFEKAGDLLPQLPPMGDLEIAQVLASDYFFA